MAQHARKYKPGERLAEAERLADFIVLSADRRCASIPSRSGGTHIMTKDGCPCDGFRYRRECVHGLALTIFFDRRDAAYAQHVAYLHGLGVQVAW